MLKKHSFQNKTLVIFFVILYLFFNLYHYSYYYILYPLWICYNLNGITRSLYWWSYWQWLPLIRIAEKRFHSEHHTNELVIWHELKILWHGNHFNRREYRMEVWVWWTSILYFLIRILSYGTCTCKVENIKVLKYTPLVEPACCWLYSHLIILNIYRMIRKASAVRVMNMIIWIKIKSPSL